MGARVVAGLGAVWIAGCSFVADYPDTAEETGNDFCHDGIDNDLDGDPDCVDQGCEDSCPRVADIERPELDPCFAAEGFRFVATADEEDQLQCVPFTASPDSCDDGQVLLPGASGCRDVTDRGCDEGGPPAGAIHVRPGASGGDGTADAPYGSIAAAVAAAEPEDTLALAGGSYEEAAVIDKALTLAGACDGTSRIVVGGGQPAVQIASDGVGLERLAVAAGGAAIAVDGDRDVRLRGIHIEGAVGAGLDVAGGAVHAEELVVDGVTGEGSAGVRVRDGGTLAMLGGFVRGGEGVGVDVSTAQATLRAVAVADTAGDGVAVGEGGLATLEGAVVQRSGGSLVSVDCRDGSADCLTMIGSVLEGDPSGAGAMGVEVRSGGAQIEKSQVRGATGQGVLVESAAVSLIDVLVRETDGTEERTGVGIEVRGAGVLDGERIELRNNTNRGLLVHGPGSRAAPHDLSVLADLELTSRGVGIEVRDGASLILMGFYVWEAGSCGVALRGEVTMSLSSGVVEGGSAGTCVYGGDYSVGELTSSVTYEGMDEPTAVR